MLHTFIPNKSIGQLADISPKNFKFLKPLIHNFHIFKYGLLIKFLYLLEKEDKININLVINQNLKYKKWCAIQFNRDIEFL